MDVRVEPMVLLTQRRIPVRTMRVLRVREKVCGLEGDVGERVRRMRSESSEEGVPSLQRVVDEDDVDPVAVRTWMVGMVTEGSGFGFSVVSMMGWCDLGRRVGVVLGMRWTMRGSYDLL